MNKQDAIKVIVNIYNTLGTVGVCGENNTLRIGWCMKALRELSDALNEGTEVSGDAG